MTRGADEEAWKRARRKRSARLAMLGRFGEPDDIANAVAFFASPDSGWVTAQVLAVTAGGWIIWGARVVSP